MVGSSEYLVSRLCMAIQCRFGMVIMQGVGFLAEYQATKRKDCRPRLPPLRIQTHSKYGSEILFSTVLLSKRMEMDGKRKHAV